MPTRTLAYLATASDHPKKFFSDSFSERSEIVILPTFGAICQKRRIWHESGKRKIVFSRSARILNAKAHFCQATSEALKTYYPISDTTFLCQESIPDDENQCRNIQTEKNEVVTSHHHSTGNLLADAKSETSNLAEDQLGEKSLSLESRCAAPAPKKSRKNI